MLWEDIVSTYFRIAQRVETVPPPRLVGQASLLHPPHFLHLLIYISLKGGRGKLMHIPPLPPSLPLVSMVSNIPIVSTASDLPAGCITLNALHELFSHYLLLQGARFVCFTNPTLPHPLPKSHLSIREREPLSCARAVALPCKSPSKDDDVPAPPMPVTHLHARFRGEAL